MIKRKFFFSSKFYLVPVKLVSKEYHEKGFFFFNIKRFCNDYVFSTHPVPEDSLSAVENNKAKERKKKNRTIKVLCVIFFLLIAADNLDL